MGERFGRDLTPMLPKMVDGIGEVGGVPIDDGGDHEVQARGPELLGVRSAIGDASLLERADHLRERMALFALVETGLAEPPKLW